MLRQSERALQQSERMLFERAPNISDSPTASLFRNSRLATVITPLPRPPNVRVTAKDSYPRHQAIFSPAASRSRGDFGLKRNLPPRVKNQYIRYNELDTFEHRTTFESAHDHVLMVKKWQEMNIPLGKQRLYAHIESAKNISAFQTDLEPTDEASKLEDPIIWGSNQPVLSKLGSGELEDFIKRELLPKRSKFLRWCYLKEWHETTDRETEKRLIDDPKYEAPKPPKRAEANIEALRADMPNLNKLIKEYFQLPSSNAQPYATHPSAGLHYILNGSHMRNDPQRGPLRDKIVVGRNYNLNSKAKLALIGGFAVNSASVGSLDHLSRLATTPRRVTASGFTSMEAQSFLVSQAHITPAGKIKLTALPTHVRPNDTHAPRSMSSTERLREWEPKTQTGNRYAQQVNRPSQGSVDLHRIREAGQKRHGGEVQSLRSGYEPLIRNLTDLTRNSKTIS